MNKDLGAGLVFILTWTLGVYILFRLNAQGSMYGLYWVVCATIGFLYRWALGKQNDK